MKHISMLSKVVCACLLFIASSGFAQTETDWPKNGYSVYYDNDGDTVIIRDSENNYIGRMELNIPGADYHYPSNVANSQVFEYTDSTRVTYDDANKNGLKDGFVEDFDSLDTGALSDYMYNVYGQDLVAQGIYENFGNKYLKIEFDSPYTLDTFPTPGDFNHFLSFGLIQTTDFAEPINLHNSTIRFDLTTTGFSPDVSSVLTVEVKARSYNPNDGSSVGYRTWRLQNYTGQVYSSQATPLYDLPANTIWQTMVFDINDMVFNSQDERHWYIPDFSDVIGCNIIVIQVPLSLGGLPNDFVASGDVYIDNFKIGSEVDPTSTEFLDTEVSIDSVESDPAHPGIFYPGDTVTVTLAATRSGSPEPAAAGIKVYPAPAVYPVSPDLIYDSTAEHHDPTFLLGDDATGTYTFSFPVPGDSSGQAYYILGTLYDPDTGNVLDTTGPDMETHDTTELAFIEAFTVSPHPNGSGPVALFTVDPETVPIEEPVAGVYTVDYTLDATDSYHINAPVNDIILYEWDLDNDGVFETSTASPTLATTDTLTGFNPGTPMFTRRITLRVTDSAIPAHTDTIYHDVTFSLKTDLTITAQESGSAIENAVCILFDSAYNPVGNGYRLTGSTGEATWSDIPLGTYIVEIYFEDTSIFSGIRLGMIEQLTVTNSSNTFILTPNAPTIADVSVVYLDNDAPIGTEEILPGTYVKLLCSVENPTNFGRQCSVKTLLDRSRSTPYDISVNETATYTVGAGETAVIPVIFSPPEPENLTTTDSYYHAVRVSTLIRGALYKTDTTAWTRTFDVTNLPANVDVELSEPFSFSGYDWQSKRWSRGAGLDFDNVWLDNEGNVNVRLKDYSGVGGEAVSMRKDFHYGTYTVRAKIPTTQTTHPEGAIFAFFLYWDEYVESLDAYHLNEIDIEFRSFDIYDNEGTLSTKAAFTVHYTNPETDGIYYYKTHFCPLPDITEEHEYQLRWTPNSVSFYIDGELAVDDEGQAAIINHSSKTENNLSFAGKIPYHPMPAIMNHWSDEPNPMFNGTPPQGVGDMVGTFSKVSYKPAAYITDITYTDGHPVLTIESLDDMGEVYIYASESVDGTYTNIGSINTVSGTTSYTFQDTGSTTLDTRFYELKYE